MQLTLFGAEPRMLAPAGDPSGDPGDLPGAPGAGHGQMDLFAPATMLARELDAALAAGRFEQAAGFRAELDRTYGPSPWTSGLVFLDRFGNLPWDGQPAEALSAWREVDDRLRNRPCLRDRLRAGVFARLLARDALLAGRDLDSRDFQQDEAVAELLAEDLSPPWLACLGLIRRLWATPRPDPSDLAALPHPPAPVGPPEPRPPRDAPGNVSTRRRV